MRWQEKAFQVCGIYINFLYPSCLPCSLMRTLRAGKKSLDEKPELSGDSILEACRLKLRLESEGRTGKVFFVPFFMIPWARNFQ